MDHLGKTFVCVLNFSISDKWGVINGITPINGLIHVFLWGGKTLLIAVITYNPSFQEK